MRLTAEGLELQEVAIVEIDDGITLEVGDIEIGAVELKDATTAARARILAGNTIAIDDVAVAVSDPNAVVALGALETDIESLEDDIETLEDKVVLNTTAVENCDAAVDLLTTATDSNKDAVVALETDIQTLELAVEALETDVQTLELAVEANTTAVDLNTTALGADLVTMDVSHKAIHDKKAWIAHFENAVTNIGEMTIIAFNSPATIEAHIYAEVMVSHNADVYLYRDTSLDVDEGTQLDIVCRNQIAPLGESAVLSIETVPVVNHMTSFNETQAADANLTTTTELRHRELVGGEGNKALGTAARDTAGMVFSGSVQVALVIVAKTDDDATHEINLHVYEEGE